METLTELQYGQVEMVEQDDYTTKLFVDFQNSKLKLIKYTGDLIKVISNTIDMCGKYGLGKIIATVHEGDHQAFLNNGFVQEAVIEGYFKGSIGYNVSYFYDRERAISHRISEEDKIIEMAKEYEEPYKPLENSRFSIRTATIEDADAMANLYDEVFKTYPTPMHDAEYIKDVILNDEVFFKVVEFDHQIISAASADMNHELLNAEMTDCATLQEFRGKGLLGELVYHLEASLKEKKFMTLFSIARAISPGINIVFSKHGYHYVGRQINNSNIMGTLEDMNIWVKRIN
ncbi:MAG: putative beta-lysine N-acetyltransferase [Firmicutes bacterium HGW-Firmicutes-7]|nr:MAG: putative beta-lysine N-acetyltransferase [Firmicutes bacterium HGW-Firmicutes-7]